MTNVKLRKAVGGFEPGTPVTIRESELYWRVQWPSGESDLVPLDELREECEKPGCHQRASYVAPGHWCREHWTEWNDLERETPDAEWMDPEREKPERVITLAKERPGPDGKISPEGTRVTFLDERLLIRIRIDGKPFQVDRVDLSIECEREGCTHEAGTWHPRFWCKAHYMEWLDHEHAEDGVPDPGDPDPDWQQGPGAGRPNNYPELSPREQWAVDKRLGILDWDGAQ